MIHSADTPWIGFDLDGTLAEHYWPQDGDFHPLRIGKPVPRMVRKARELIRRGHTLKVFTARVGVRGKSKNNAGVKLTDIHAAISAWTLEHIGTALEATCVKDYNMIALYDDRAFRVLHNTGLTCCEADK